MDNNTADSLDEYIKIYESTMKNLELDTIEDAMMKLKEARLGVPLMAGVAAEEPKK